MVTGHWMCSPAGSLAHQSSAFKHLEVVAEFFGARKRVLRGQYEDRFARELFARHVRQGPVLVGGVLFAVVEVVQVRGLVEQVGGNERDHSRLAATVLAQVENDSVTVSEKIHRRDRGGSAAIWIREKVELQVANIRGQVLRLFESAVHAG